MFKVSAYLGFGGDVAGFYHQYRRGYPSTVIDLLVDRFCLTADDIAIDLGCGTGQLTVPVASRVRAVVGMDPEPDMLAQAKRSAAGNIAWVLGVDTDLPAVAALLGGQRVGAVTIGQALHWMDYQTLFSALAGLVRPGGGVAVISNGTPMWLQDSPWSRALREFLDQWLGSSSGATCGTDDASRQRYAQALADAGFEVTEASHEYSADLDLDQVIGSLYSAIPVQKLPPPDQREAFADQLSQAVSPHAPFTEQVPVRILFGRIQ